MATSTSSTTNVYQFKVALKRMKPPIWRRIQVRESLNFRELHVAIQEAMGWESAKHDYHLHQFEMTHPITKETVGGFGDAPLNERKAKIAEYFTLSNKRATYLYDFGAGWEHDVLLEEILPAVVGDKYPKCIAGRQACPREDDLEFETEPPKFNPRLVFLFIACAFLQFPETENV